MAAENVAIPVKAEYTTGRGGAQVLLDPCGFKFSKCLGKVWIRPVGGLYEYGGCPLQRLGDK